MLSSGIPVEVCRVRAKEATQEAILKVEKKRLAQLKRENGGSNGWKQGRAKEEDLDDELQELEDDEDEKEKDEEDAEREGHWERSGKRVKI